MQCMATVRRKVVAHKNSVRQLCAANLPVMAHIVCQKSARQLCAAYLRRTLCASTVRGNCALQTYLYGAHCVPE